MSKNLRSNKLGIKEIKNKKQKRTVKMAERIRKKGSKLPLEKKQKLEKRFMRRLKL